ncbi:MAG: hypothetical protein O2960_15235 [Verrucomicrobia bacterium]|nr:hypothetical protein [Verrucomicrobiota bacterium]
MTLLPVVDRELRAASRKPATYRLRVTGAFICVAVTAWRLFSLDQMVQSQQGRALFLLLITLAFIYCLFAGLALTADCLSLEKREGTLGLLFLTNLKSHELILGKLAANSVGATYGVLAILPVLAISLIFGGVTGNEYFRAAGMLANTLFLSLATGLLMSAICHHERKAFVGAFFLIFLSIAGPILLIAIAAEYFRFPNPSEVAAVLLISPIYPFLCLRFPTLPIPQSYFWWSLLYIHLVSWVLLFAAGRIQSATWQDKPKTEKRAQWHGVLQAFLYGAGEQRRAFRERMLNTQPLLWFNARNRLKPATVWFFLGSMGLLWIWDCSQLGAFMWEADHCLFAVFLLHSIMKIWIGVESCGRFAEDQRTGALELLLTTPLKQTQFFEAHTLALRRQFAFPIAAVLAFDLLVIVKVLPARGFWNMRWLESLPEIRLIFLAAMITLVVDVLAICWVGVWEGLFARSTNRALGVTIAKVLVAPWILFICYRLVFWWLQGMSGIYLSYGGGLFSSILLWLAISLIFSLALRKRALRNLNRQFRSVASERFQGKETGAQSHSEGIIDSQR